MSQNSGAIQTGIKDSLNGQKKVISLTTNKKKALAKKPVIQEVEKPKKNFIGDPKAYYDIMRKKNADDFKEAIKDSIIEMHIKQARINIEEKLETCGMVSYVTEQEVNEKIQIESAQAMRMQEMNVKAHSVRMASTATIDKLWNTLPLVIGGVAIIALGGLYLSSR